MPQFISVEVDAETITNAMTDDPVFALEVMADIAMLLHMGSLKDDLCDSLAQADAETFSLITGEFEALADAAKSSRLMTALSS